MGELTKSQSHQGKHTAGTLESIAKRGKYDLIQSHDQRSVPNSDPWNTGPASIAGPAATVGSTRECSQSPLGIDFTCFPDFPDSMHPTAYPAFRDWNHGPGAFAFSNDMTTQLNFPAYNGEIVPSGQGTSDPYMLQELVPAGSEPWPPVHLYIVENSKPADYLFIRETQGRRHHTFKESLCLLKTRLSNDSKRTTDSK